jgi:hypothetical protein
LELVVALARTWRAQALDAAVPIDGGLDQADVVRGLRVREVILMVPLWWT